MNYVGVNFEGYEKKTYLYKTKLNLILGAKYKIKNEEGYNYRNSIVTVVETKVHDVNGRELHEIVEANCVEAPEVKTAYRIKNIYENFDKGVTTVIWTDGSKTMLECDEDDEWDREKLISLAYMKRFFNNRGCFNDEIKKWIYILAEREKDAIN